MSIALSSGWPTRSVSMRALQLGRGTSPRCLPARSSREPAQQTWPWLNQIASTTPSTAPSRSASSKTMKGDLPPSSSVSVLPDARRLRADQAADLGRAGEGDLVDAGMLDEQRAGVAVAGHDVEHARRQPGLRRSSANSSAVSERELGRLQHHRVAERQRRRDLPGQHQQRKVPGDDLPDDADRHAGRRIRAPAAAPSRRDDRSAAPPAACRCRASRGSACRCRSSRAPRAGARGAGSCAPAHRDGARAPGRRASHHAPCALRAAATAASTSAASPCATRASSAPVAGSIDVEVLAGRRRRRTRRR